MTQTTAIDSPGVLTAIFRPEAEFRTRMAARRAELGWSQQRLATEAGLSQEGVSQIETGRRAPALVTAWRIAAALGTTLDQMTGNAA
jgi:putative transcriptional regulator